MKTKKTTEKQIEVLEVIKSFYKKNKRYPCYKELLRLLNTYSESANSRRFASLERRKLIKIEEDLYKISKEK